MLSNLQLALICGDTYYFQNNFDKWFSGASTQDVCFGIKKVDSGTVIAFEGSHDLEDWIRNFDVLTDNDPVLGVINFGLSIGTNTIINAITAVITKSEPVWVTGHSRGGSYAIYIGALLMKLGYTVVVAAFDPPKTMYKTSTTLSEIFEGEDVIITQNGDDVVPTLPDDYLHPVPVTKINYNPISLDPEMQMEWHHIQLIICYFAKLERGL